MKIKRQCDNASATECDGTVRYEVQRLLTQVRPASCVKRNSSATETIITGWVRFRWHRKCRTNTVSTGSATLNLFPLAAYSQLARYMTQQGAELLSRIDTKCAGCVSDNRQSLAVINDVQSAASGCTATDQWFDDLSFRSKTLIYFCSFVRKATDCSPTPR